MAIMASLSPANRRGVLVHGSFFHGMLPAMSCFSFEGWLPFSLSEQFSPVLALVTCQSPPFPATSPAFTRPGARAAMYGAGVANAGMALGFGWLSDRGRKARIGR